MPGPVTNIERVSDHYALGRQQAQLDFVDVAVRADTKLFVDPRALLLLNSQWAADAVSLVQGFFHEVLLSIKKGNDARAQKLLSMLKEPNETRLGLSAGAPRGRALGDGSAGKMWEALARSQAVKSGLLEDLEDTILMVEGIGIDIVSDITTDLIRGPLIVYTQEICNLYGIELVPDVVSGPLWDPQAKVWTNEFVELPVIGHNKLLLVPKAIVRRSLEYNVPEYFRNFILPDLIRDELAKPVSSLVEVLRSGRRIVKPEAIIKKYGSGKRLAIEQTLHNPSLLDAYRESKRKQPRRKPLTHEQLANDLEVPAPDWEALLEAVENTQPGRPGASEYHDAVLDLLNALFYPSLTMPRKEQPIHAGRKRIDITYTNISDLGFFNWVGKHYPAAHIFIECKNYTADPANAELDQLQGRLSPSRGKVGLLVCRSVRNRALMDDRCRDTAADDRGFIIVLDDDDLRSLVEQRTKTKSTSFQLLKRRFESLVM